MGIRNANIELGVPSKPETKFRLGSITKQFTAAAILQLQEKGKLRVDDPISKHIQGTPAAWSGITIRHMTVFAITHSNSRRVTSFTTTTRDTSFSA